jgi:hypothetical protein
MSTPAPAVFGRNVAQPPSAVFGRNVAQSSSAVFGRSPNLEAQTCGWGRKHSRGRLCHMQPLTVAAALELHL